MSSMTLHIVPEHGEVYNAKEFWNAWLGAAAIWTTLGEKYLGGKRDYVSNPNGFSMMDRANCEKLWGFSENPCPLTAAERVVLVTTMDMVMARWENLPRLAQAFRDFQAEHSTAAHCLAQADYIEQELLPGDAKHAICWTQTSVAGDVWYSPRCSDEKHYMWDIEKDEGHWYLYEELAKEEDFLEEEKENES